MQPTQPADNSSLPVLVTGAAGFIGSHIAERLVERGHPVLGVDSFVDFYPRAQKEANLAHLRRNPLFSFEEADIASVSDKTLDGWLAAYPHLTHQAAQAGVRPSWGHEFERYTQCNILATQRLLESARTVGVKRFVYASSSSVYGAADHFPLREDGPTIPLSPYGVTKLAAEHLAGLYQANFGVPTVALRYFTVYGPRQRPDMAFHRLIRSALYGDRFPMYGDGSQARSFTFVSDVVDANIAALFMPELGEHLGRPMNIGGGEVATLSEAMTLIEELTGRSIDRESGDVAKGDVPRTDADTSAAHVALGFSPKVSLREGLTAEIEWMRASFG